MEWGFASRMAWLGLHGIRALRVRRWCQGISNPLMSIHAGPSYGFVFCNTVKYSNAADESLALNHEPMHVSLLFTKVGLILHVFQSDSEGIFMPQFGSYLLMSLGRNLCVNWQPWLCVLIYSWALSMTRLLSPVLPIITYFFNIHNRCAIFSFCSAVQVSVMKKWKSCVLSAFKLAPVIWAQLIDYVLEVYLLLDESPATLTAREIEQ